MITFDLLVCAERLMKETDNDAYSAINILEDFPVETFPTFIPRLSVLLISSKLTDDPNSIKVDFSILNNTEVIFSTQVPINFADKKKANTALNISHIGVKAQGKLTFKFSFDEKSIDYSINVWMRDTPPKATIEKSTIT